MSQEAGIDPGALMGTALAAFLALILASGPWRALSIILGITLTLLLLASYRVEDWGIPRETAIVRGAALGAVSGLCADLIVAYPLQEWWARRNFAGCYQSQDIDGCFAHHTTDTLWLPWLVVFVTVSGIYFHRWRRRQSNRRSVTKE
ncbi:MULTISPECIES: hypothetical protein [unclassified Pseudofrankia]|uniref:hypothetical protein n=1 Tax=unclassified Pseudofrankia TaxID=2994372 RepID=UPI00104205D1|nr:MULTISPECIES: hypothetical protein [unclassified Pseudofrankia]MDT3443215.1 hypothetical protein [Pseudofrankia sp. BMG5.37]